MNRKEIKENHGTQYQKIPTLKDGTGKKVLNKFHIER
jgi:hypothetical protein